MYCHFNINYFIYLILISKTEWNIQENYIVFVIKLIYYSF